MTKQEEIETLASFIAGLPGASYLADYLAGTLEQFRDIVANDLSFPTVAHTWRDRERERADFQEFAKDISQKRDTLKREVSDLERRANHAREELAQVRKDAARLCSVR